MSLSEISPGVYVDDRPIVTLRQSDLDVIVRRARTSHRRRARICTHAKSSAEMQEMLICLDRSTYIRPHKHTRVESFHLISGRCEFVVFDDCGNVTDVIRMGTFQSDECFYYRVSEPRFHTQLICSEHVVFHEATTGPFDPAATEFASWAPLEGDEQAVREFLRKLQRDIADLRRQ